MLNGVWEEIGEAYNIVFLVPDFAPNPVSSTGWLHLVMVRLSNHKGGKDKS